MMCFSSAYRWLVRHIASKLESLRVASSGGLNFKCWCSIWYIISKRINRIYLKYMSSVHIGYMSLFTFQHASSMSVSCSIPSNMSFRIENRSDSWICKIPTRSKSLPGSLARGEFCRSAKRQIHVNCPIRYSSFKLHHNSQRKPLLFKCPSV